MSWQAVALLNLFGAAAILVSDLTDGADGASWLVLMGTEAAQSVAWYGRMLATYAFGYERIHSKKYWDLGNIGLEAVCIGFNMFLLASDSSAVNGWIVSNLVASGLSAATSVKSAFVVTDLQDRPTKPNS